jgi:molecular chaperone GrpE
MKKEQDKPTSEEIKKQDEPKVEAETNQDAKPVPIEEQLILAQEEIANWKNKYAMVYADMDNLRKQQEKVLMDALRYRAEGFVEKLLPVLEAFHIALKNPVDDPKLKNYLTGFQYLHNQLQSAIEGEGVKEITTKVGDEFNVMTMHALDTQIDEGPPNRVLKILTPGYKLHERVIKQVFVVVSKKPEPTKVEGETKQGNNGEQAA